MGLCPSKHSDFHFQAVDLRSSEVLHPPVKVNGKYPKSKSQMNLSIQY